jgi:uncharacterized protein YggE
MLTIEEPEAALDEARAEALSRARGRAEFYARNLGMRVGRVLSVSEATGGFMPMRRIAESRDMVANDAATQIVPGEQTLNVVLPVRYELE